MPIRASDSKMNSPALNQLIWIVVKQITNETNLITQKGDQTAPPPFNICEHQ